MHNTKLYSAHQIIFCLEVRKTYTEDQVDHNMEVTGWGETPKGTKYWVIRNSWGTYFGSHQAQISSNSSGFDEF